MMEFQPRYAAWLASLGLPVSGSSLAEVRARFGLLRNIEFMIWIRRCLATAPKGTLINGSVADHDAFTAHCWKQASADCLAAHPA
ncbi:hypothetical protein [Sphingobium sp. HDIP04]|uniref:hypothetical protein n=1 Tax=Sphingobium sp. HDIP04 TaxID=428994 RepID=UPI0003878EEE|nr:hypothetical protein [Sphingobium sp. HDIP04]EQB03885.1 hypothetical protein L286_11005 [Sphingobium sp. HDIP04]